MQNHGESALRATIETLRSLIVRERPVYHVFETRGTRLLYDLGSGAHVELNPPAYELLRGLEARREPDEIAAAVAQAGGVDLASLSTEVRELHELGLFQSAPFDGDAARERTLAALRGHRPRNIMLLVHTSCNLACDYCYEVLSGFHFTGGRMPFDTARRILDHYLERAAGRDAISVTFFGGEPLLNFPVVKQCVDYCDAFARRTGTALTYSLTTNGTLLDDESISFLVERRFSVMLSIDGEPAKADLHRHDRLGRGVTAQALANAKRLVEAQRGEGIQEACIRATLTRENASLVETYAFFEREGFRRVMVGASVPRDHHHARPWDIDGAARESLKHEQEALVSAYGCAETPQEMPRAAQELAKSLQEIHEALARPSEQALIGCGAGNNMLAYAADGRIFPCHRFANEEPYALGNVAEGGPDPARLERFYSDIIGVRTEVCASAGRALCARASALGSSPIRTDAFEARAPRAATSSARASRRSYGSTRRRASTASRVPDRAGRVARMAGRENANESIERDDGELRGADVVYGAAGQPIQRRELLKRTFVGFTVVWVGAQATQAQGGTVKPPVKREPALCGQYNGQTLTGDGHCGIGGAQDRSCGLPITENDWGGPAGQDFQCHAGAIDSDCGKPASSAGHHSDSYCSSYSVDASCGLPYAPGETMADYDCLSVSASDSDCGKPKIGGGTWQDG